MSTIPSINQDLAGVGLSRRLGGEGNPSDLGQEDFLRLMMAHFKNQDPTKPVDNAEFVAQLASFGTVSGIRELNDSFGRLSSSFNSNQALQASSLLGRNVLVAQQTGFLAEAGSLEGAVDVPAGATAVNVQVVDRFGQVVRNVALGQRPAGLAPFAWDGRTDLGGVAQPGQYTVRAQAVVGNRPQAAPTLVEAAVESVTLGGAAKGVTINLRGLGTVPMSDVRQIS
ncbi:MAG: flagellar hook assembly protein FlgD [Pseudomonadota bacterium]